MSEPDSESLHEMAAHGEAVRTARELLSDADDDELDTLILALRYDDGHHDVTVSSQQDFPDSGDIMHLIGDQIVYLAEKHDSHPAGVVNHLIELLQARDDTPGVESRE